MATKKAKKNGSFGNAPVGSGERFAECVKQMTAAGKTNPEGLCASIGRKKYGKQAFQEMAAAGRKGKKK